LRHEGRFISCLYVKSAVLNPMWVVIRAGTVPFAINVTGGQDVKMIGVNLSEDLIARAKSYVQKIKKDRTYSLQELVRVSLETFLYSKGEKQNDGKD
jgi:hypothetical protein